MKPRDAIAIAVLLTVGAAWAVAGAGLAAVEPAAGTPATQPAPTVVTKPPDVMKEAVDPFDPGKQRERFFIATGPDNELSKDDFAASVGKPDAFARTFDSFEAMLAFDKDRNGTIDWFEAKAYRENLRERVIAEYDADKDGKLTGEERDKANRALAAGRVPKGKTAGRRGDWLALDPETVARHDADGDGRLSAEERGAMWRARAEQARRDVLDQYDANKDGTLDEAERKAFVDQMKSRWALRRFDRDSNGALDETEAAAAAAAEERFEQQRRQWAALRDEMLEKHDADGDGKLTGDERRAAWNDLRARWQTKAFDADGDGKLNEDEVAAMQGAEAERKATFERWRSDWVRKHDADGDGQLSEAERRAGYEAVRKELGDLAARWRNQWDADGDGQLSDQERQAMRDSLRRRGEELRKELDADGDGRITGQEMQAFWQKLKEVYDADGDGQLSSDEARMMLRDQMQKVRGGSGR